MRKDMILDVAYTKFADKGYHVTLTEIAEAAGIKKQSLYNYFNSKDELFYELILKVLDSFFSMKKEEVDRLSDLNPDEKLKALFFMIVNGFSQDITKLRFWRWLLLIESKDLLNKTKSIIDEHARKFTTHLEELIVQVFNEKSNDSRNKILQTYLVLLYGTIDSILLYSNSYDAQKLTQNLTDNVWETFWNSVNCSI